MQIQSGKLFKNKTWAYIYPLLRLYGNDLIKYLNQFIKLGIGLGDTNLKYQFGKELYILLSIEDPNNTNQNNLLNTMNFNRFLNWLKDQDFYIRDYLYILRDRNKKHMIVLKIPENTMDKNSFDYFIDGKYSLMYNKDILNKVFNNSTWKHSYKVLTKDKSYIQTFVNIVNKDFDTNITVSDYINAELDYPPLIEEEIFNYKNELEWKN